MSEFSKIPDGSSVIGAGVYHVMCGTYEGTTHGASVLRLNVDGVAVLPILFLRGLKCPTIM